MDDLWKDPYVDNLRKQLAEGKITGQEVEDEMKCNLRCHEALRRGWAAESILYPMFR